MKPHHFLVIMLLTFNLFVQAQDIEEEKLTDKFKLDFAVPEIPAFKALGTEPSKLLKPSDITSVSFLSNVYDNISKGTFPDEFGIEFSPGRIASKNWTVQQFNEGEHRAVKRFLYYSSFSLGTDVNDKNGATSLAAGYRFSISQKKGDIIRDTAFHAEYSPLLGGTAEEEADILEDFCRSKELPANCVESEFTTEQKAEFESYREKRMKGSKVDEARENLLNEYEKKYWNARRIDLALAFSGASDSLIKNLQFSKANLWLTFTNPIGAKGQLLIGLNYEFLNEFLETPESHNIVLPVRFLAGNNNYKGFIEYQQEFQKMKDVDDSQLKGVVNLGAEARIRNNFWVQFTAGVENIYDDEVDVKSQFLSSVNLIYGFSKKQD